MSPREVMLALEARLYTPHDPSPEHIAFLREAAELLHEQGDGPSAQWFEQWARELETGQPPSRPRE